MKITFLGAAHEVTGSCYLLEAAGKRMLIDCGMVQGADYYENQHIAVNPAEIAAVFLTHAHIDHSGNLPLLYKNGYTGPVYTVTATWNLCEIMLRDSAHIQETEAEWKNRKAKRSGRALIAPLYDTNDAEGILSLFQGVEYGEAVEPFDGVSAVFTDAGHLLGSASVTFVMTEDGKTTKIVFSGDIGNLNQPLLHDPHYLSEADYVVMESTYGDRTHGPEADYVEELSSVLQRTFARGGNVVVPSFAVGRTQEMLYFLRQIKERRLLSGYDDFVVYVDSPLAIEATSIFLNTPDRYYDQEAKELIEKGINPIGFDGLTATRTSDESKAINFDKRRKVIIAASGMCEAGRIRHHLKHNLWGRENTILFVGYQAEGTLGRKILDGEKEVKLFSEEIAVHAEVRTLSGTSSHADVGGLLKWIDSFLEKPKRVFVTHGQDEVVDRFGELLQEKGYYVGLPYYGAEYDLSKNLMLKEGKKRKKKQAPQAQTQFEKLRTAGEKLLSTIDSLRGVANRELQAMAKEIYGLIDKYKRK